MKKSWNRLLMVVVLVACGGEKATEPAAPTSIQLSATAVSLRIAETRQVTATVLDQQNRPISGQSVSWRSSDTTRLTIDAAGSIRALRPGGATLTATSGALTASVAATVLTPAMQVEQAGAASATIGPAGGQIEARASTGARFTLSVPPQALSSDTTITVTPIASITDMPNGTSVVTAIRLQPDGLKFLAPVMVTMDLSAAPSTSGLSGMRIGHDGSLTLAPVAVNGSRLTMTIAHFSGAGVGNGLCSLPLASILGGQTAADIALAELAYEQCNAGSGSMNATTVLNILHKWYTTSVKPGLQSATASATATASFGDWVQWRHTVDAYLPLLGPTSGINADVAEAAPLAVGVVKGEIARLNQSCVANQDLSAAVKVFYWQALAQGEQLATSGSGLDAATVLSGICVKVVIEETDFPSQVAEGDPATLTVRAGLRFGTGPVVHVPSLRVQVTASGAAPSTSSQMTGSAGQAAFTITPASGSGSLQLDVRVAPTTLGLESSGVFETTTITRQMSQVNITITPVAALLNPGTQATFTATVTGTSNQAVAWSATGGTITPSGTYTAGSTAGTFQVKATSVAVPSRSATATVTVIVNSVVYETSFGGTIDTVWSHRTAETSPGGQRYLGKFANEAVQLSLANLPTHGKVEVELDLYIVASWDGSNTTKPGNGPDIVTITLGGTTVLHATFSNVNGVDDHRQSYPDNYPGPLHDAATGAFSKNTLGYTEGSDHHNRDSIYRLRFEVDHTASTIVLQVKGTNITPPPDEWWGLDNIRVIVR